MVHRDHFTLPVGYLFGGGAVTLTINILMQLPRGYFSASPVKQAQAEAQGVKFAALQKTWDAVYLAHSSL